MVGATFTGFAHFPPIITESADNPARFSEQEEPPHAKFDPFDEPPV
jgi:hypothetical protein